MAITPVPRKAAAKPKGVLGSMSAQQLLDAKDKLNAREFETEARRILGADALPRVLDYASFVQALQDRAQKQAEGKGNALRPMET